MSRHAPHQGQLRLFPEPGASRIASPEDRPTHLDGSPLERWVRHLGGSAARVVVTSNRTVLASLGGPFEARRLRVHPVLAGAPDPVAEALARLYLQSPRRDTRRALHARLRTYLREHEAELPTPTGPRLAPPEGEIHDLAAVFRRVNERFFGGRLQVELGWTRKPGRRTLSRWYEVPGAISRIGVNRLLDHEDVPARVLEYLLYHEGLHELLRDHRHRGKRVYHHAEFRRRERLFQGWREAGREAERFLARLWRTLRARR
ncbi:MAG: hypothetical protein L0216_11760 [Planctomycetales bacterium]|nr:hypothetical protein [Planctomycetales bacterium]